MPKRKRKPARTPLRALLTLAAGVAVLFLGGELFLLSRSDGGRLMLASRFGLGDEARVRQLVGRLVRRGLTAAGVPADSIRESFRSEMAPTLRWRVGLGPGASLIQANYAITRSLEEQGAQVLSGRERAGALGRDQVTLVVGLPRRPTHEIVLVRDPRATAEGAEPARVALVLYGLGDDPAHAARVLDLPWTFAAAIVPGGPESAGLFRTAAERGREIVLHLPLEPVNYPRVNPGPGAVLVTMKPARITGLVRRYLDRAGRVTAVANHMGSLATQDMTVMGAVYRELKRRGLPFMNVAPVAGSVCRELAADQGVSFAEPDAVIDVEARGPDTRALDRRWKSVLEEARRRGRVIVWLRATPRAVEWLNRAAPPKQLEGVRLVPLSSVLRRPLAL
ncbi:MAG: hypothetical protein A2W00_00590 [Candidatus Eisenbacteria bacterium RBG_16_71_46]|nr:MAG: hypothetical protein A2W00_00590 [Candidatus Eisenbacteria bacterium RBG_16_71_46]